MPQLEVGDLVKGKSKLLKRKRGSVAEVIAEGSRKKYRVDWTDLTSGVIFGRSLEKLSAVGSPAPLIGPILAEHETPVPRREDDLYEENDSDSDDDIGSVGEPVSDGDNELQPEDGLVEGPMR